MFDRIFLKHFPFSGEIQCLTTMHYYPDNQRTTRLFWCLTIFPENNQTVGPPLRCSEGLIRADFACFRLIPLVSDWFRLIPTDSGWYRLVQTWFRLDSDLIQTDSDQLPPNNQISVENPPPFTIHNVFESEQRVWAKPPTTYLQKDAAKRRPRPPISK